jgi:predicted nucleotide-binding protein (sugar kinase/HSP70/actin superfamily)
MVGIPKNKLEFNKTWNREKNEDERFEHLNNLRNTLRKKSDELGTLLNSKDYPTDLVGYTGDLIHDANRCANELFRAYQKKEMNSRIHKEVYDCLNYLFYIKCITELVEFRIAHQRQLERWKMKRVGDGF